MGATQILEQTPVTTTFSSGTRPTVVGLTGFARSGKDTAAQALLDRGFERVAFADPLKQSLEILNPYLFDGTRLADALAEHGGWEGLKQHPVHGGDDGEARRLPQVQGTEVGRQIFGSSIWLHLAGERIATLRSQDRNLVVITDVRFPNEAEWVRSFGWPVIRINRPGVGPVNGHASDAGLPAELVDHELDNDSTIEVLHRRILELVPVGVR